MRLNVYIAQATGLSRRAADRAIDNGHVLVNDQPPQLGQQIGSADSVTYNGEVVAPKAQHTTVILNKPTGYVCSRDGQGSKTVYELLPRDLYDLKPVGRLDKDSSGLILLSNDGQLAFELTHPSKQKVKVYEVTLSKPLQPLHQQMISDYGVTLSDGLSKFMIQKDDDALIITMREGRNRQIRRTFVALGYQIKTLHRTQFGNYTLGDLAPGAHQIIS